MSLWRSSGTNSSSIISSTSLSDEVQNILIKEEDLKLAFQQQKTRMLKGVYSNICVTIVYRII